MGTINRKDTLVKRQWTKYVSKGEAMTLMNFNSESKLFKSYKNTSYCNEVFLSNDAGKLTATYCKNRWCRICQRIKTAKLLNGYVPQLEELDDLYFVTLTKPTVIGEHLPDQIREMEEGWRKIYQLSRKAKYKRFYKPLRGIRKAEATIRPDGRYHYHFHVMVDGKAEANWLLDQWLSYNPSSDRKAQDVRKATKGAMIELFKYSFKAEIKIESQQSAKQLDVLFNALCGKRMINAFGGISMISEEFTEEELIDGISIGEANQIFKWFGKTVNDWVNLSSGDLLVGKPIPDKVRQMVSYPDS